MTTHEIPKYERLSFESALNKWLREHKHRYIQYTVYPDLSVDMRCEPLLRTNEFFTFRSIPIFKINSFITPNLSMVGLDLINMKHVPKLISSRTISFSMCYLQNIDDFPTTTKDLYQLSFNGCKKLNDFSALANICDDVTLSIANTCIVDLSTLPKNLGYLECIDLSVFDNIANIHEFKRLKRFVLSCDRDDVKLRNILDVLQCHKGIDIDIMGYGPGPELVLDLYRSKAQPIDFMMDAYLALEHIGYTHD